MGTQQEGSRTPSRRTGDPKQPSVLVVGEVPFGWDDELAAEFDLTSVTEHDDGIAFAESHHPDAIVVCGTENESAILLGVLSRSPETMVTPVVLISHDVDPDDRALALERGACDLISDRSNARELAARISSALRSSERFRDLRLGTDRDTATGLPLRSGFLERVEGEMARSRRHNNSLSIMLVEADELGAVVAEHGAVAGEELMAQIARILRRALRTSDEAFRYDARTLAVILPETEISAAHRAGNRMMEVVEAVGYGPGGVTLSLDRGPGGTISIGIAEIESGATVESLTTRAEGALRLARESGGGVAWRSDDPRRAGVGSEALAATLTPREWTVLARLAKRETEQEIAARLGIRAGTVRSHKARIRRKLNIRRNVRLSEFAREHLTELMKRMPPTEERP
ncbi:MAG: diguanylate cyclase [Actinobacteria bacterium]|nr:diguanylate cyclase [Actinomycetota bacterium]